MLPSPITGLDLGLASETHHLNSLNQSSHVLLGKLILNSGIKYVTHTLLTTTWLWTNTGVKENAHGLGEADSAILQRGGLVLTTTPQTKSLQLHWGRSHVLYGIWLVKVAWDHS